MSSRNRQHRSYKPRALHEGDYFNRVRLTKIEFVDRPPIDLGSGVLEFITDTRYTFRCDCGKQFQLWSYKFRGKRKLRDCGRCHLAKHDGVTVKMVLDVPEGLFKKVRVYEEEENLGSFSTALLRLVEVSGWDWRKWDGRSDLPKECWKFGVRVGEYKVKKCITVPKVFNDQIEAAMKLYGQGRSRVVVGLLERGVRKVMGMREVGEKVKEGEMDGEMKDDGNRMDQQMEGGGVMS